MRHIAAPIYISPQITRPLREIFMLRKFYKMQGIGNDYIYFDCMHEPIDNPEELE